MQDCEGAQHQQAHPFLIFRPELNDEHSFSAPQGTLYTTTPGHTRLLWFRLAEEPSAHPWQRNTTKLRQMHHIAPHCTGYRV